MYYIIIETKLII